MKRRYKDFDFSSIGLKISDLFKKVIEIIKNQVSMAKYHVAMFGNQHRMLAGCLQAALKASAFFDAINGLSAITSSMYKTFTHLLNVLFRRIENANFSGKKTVEKILKGLFKLGTAYFKIRVAEELSYGANGYR